MIAIIGTGPSAIACARALISRGVKPVFIDVGNQLESEISNQVAEVNKQDPQEWVNGVQNVWTVNNLESRPLFDKKKFGSDFSYRGSEDFLRLDDSRVHLKGSFALGGLSNVWGGAILPYLDEDIADWPISYGDLRPHYESILQWLPLANHRGDDLFSRFFPISHPSSSVISLSKQMRALESSFSRCQDRLASVGIFWGRSRLAVIHSQNDRECQLCNLCLTGCPSDLIYSTRQSLESMVRSGEATYLSGVQVRRIQRKNESIEIHGINLQDMKPVCLKARKVFLGAGALHTTKIVLNSLNAFNQTVTLKDSAYFLIPFLNRKKGDKMEELRSNSLSQFFLEIRNTGVSKNGAHLQVYGASEPLHQEVRRFLPTMPLMKSLGKHLVRRLSVLQGFLHSRDSASLSLSLRGDGERNRLCISKIQNTNSVAIIRRLQWLLLRNSNALGGITLMPFTYYALPGRGFHWGGTFPMRHHPGPLETDILGQFSQLNGLHVIDASIFPSIPSMPIAYSIMANAHRIGSDTALDLNA